jgi:23S rRNA (cytidine1920-2'-O)/16S rRNA (cytidine1409-2'-O)-methyltransferase
MSEVRKSEIRIDQWLSLHGMANSRTHAASLVEQGQVEIWHSDTKVWRKPAKPSQKISAETARDHVRVLSGPANRYVSRGGLKLEGALRHSGLKVEGKRILDVGVSTGGFSDCCLQQGAAFVVGVDVGHDQLSPAMAHYQNFKLLEGINARHLSEISGEHKALQECFDLIVGDLSFISITAVLPQLHAFLGPEGCILFLVKPQFELDSKALNKNGIVKDLSSYDIVKARIMNCCEQADLKVEDYFASEIEGKDGNKEFFLWARPNDK